MIDDGNAEAIVRVENAHRIGLRGCKVVSAGWIGVLFWHLAQNCEVSNCLVNHTGYDGICASGFNPGAPPFKTPQEADVNFGHRIFNNAVLNSGLHSGHGAAIQFWQSGRHVVENNHTRRAPRYGISYNCWPWNPGDTIYGIAVTPENQYQFRYAHDIVLRYNDVGLVCRDSSDFGALQCWWPGRDNLWEYNAVHDVHADVDWDGWAHGVYADDGVHHFLTRGNVFYCFQGGGATRGWMQKGIAETAENNVLADCRMFGAVSAEPYNNPCHDEICRRNIFAVDVKEHYTGPGGALAKDFDYNLFWPPALKLGFQRIPMDKIGLRQGEFPFDLDAIERREARDRLQAEDNDRLHRTRNYGSTRVDHVEQGGWLKFANIAFGAQSPVGVADLDIINGEGQENCCAYLRASLHAEQAVDKLPLIVHQDSGVKVWFNGAQVIGENGVGRKGAVVPIKAGWNTILVKINQNDAGHVPRTEGQGNFWCRVGFEQSDRMGVALSVPGLPLEDKPADDARIAGVAMEVRLDSVEGPVIGTFRHGETEVATAAPVTGIHDVYLVFPQEAVKSVNWFRFE